MGDDEQDVISPKKKRKFGWGKEEEEEEDEEEENDDDDDDDDIDDDNIDDNGGIPIEKFSMKKEKNEGYFDKESGSYVKYLKSNDGKDDDDDEWLKSLPQTKSKSIPKQEDNNYVDIQKSKDQYLQILFSLLNQDDETVTAALLRLGKLLKTSKQDFEQLTETANALQLYYDLHDVYSFTWKDIRLELSYRPPMWEYIILPDDSTIYGPFTAEVMQAWKNQGHFSSPEATQNMKIRISSSSHQNEASDCWIPCYQVQNYLTKEVT